MVKRNPPPETVPWGSGSAYLHPSESHAQYDQLRSALMADLDPQDMIETIWVEDVVALVWESHRLRRVKRAMLEIHQRALMRQAIRTTFANSAGRDDSTVDDIMEAHDRQERAAQEMVVVAVAKNPVHAADPVAFAHYGVLHETLSVDKAIEGCDKRRDAVLSNLYARRQLLVKLREQT